MNSVPSPRLVGTYIWLLDNGVGCEKTELFRDFDRWILRGTIVRLEESGPAEVRYEIVCDTGWHTTRSNIRMRDSKNDRILQLTKMVSGMRMDNTCQFSTAALMSTWSGVRRQTRCRLDAWISHWEKAAVC
jgi:hypothetical protein